MSVFNLASTGSTIHQNRNQNGQRCSSAVFAQNDRGQNDAIRNVAVNIWCHLAPQAASVFSTQSKIFVENEVATLGCRHLLLV